MIPDGGAPAGPPGNGDDLGQPIQALLTDEREPSSGFLQRLRRKIHRRTATTQFASYGWNLPKMILVEFLNLFVYLVSSQGRRKNP